MKIREFRKNMRSPFLSKLTDNSAYLQSRTSLLGLCFVSMVSLIMVFIFSVNIAYGARTIISWMKMFEDVFAYEEAMRSSGIQKYDRIQDATDMLADANAYERDVRVFVDDHIKNRSSRNDYVMERDFNDFHEKRLRELQNKWSRSKYLIECATQMAEYVRDSNLKRMKSLMAADPNRVGGVTSKNDASTKTVYVDPEEHNALGLIERATVFVIVIDAREEKVSIGTGFFVAPGIILTNRHVVGDKNAKVAVLSKAVGRPTQAQIVAISDRKERDYALLRVGSSGDTSTLAFSTDVKPNDKVTAWGFPYAAIMNDPKFKAVLQGDMRSAPDVVFSEGVINSIQNQDPPFIMHNAIISGGSSGGPLVNMKGQVLGINTSVFTNTAYRQSGASISATDIIKFMGEHGITPTGASGSR